MDIFGRYQSQSTLQLHQIDSTKYPDTNKDIEANLVRLNQFMDYVAQYLGVMQKGIDQAKKDPLTQLRDTVFNMGALLGGGELLYGIDLGNLQYYLPAIAAMFGFDSSVPFPINLLYAAEHFFLGYIIPLDSWQVAVEGIIDGWMIALGLTPAFIDAVHLLLDNLGRFTGDLLTLFHDVTGMLGVFNIFDFVGGPIGPIWAAFSALLANFNVAHLGAIVDPFLETLTPWILALAQLIGYVDDFIEAFSGGLGGGSGTLSNPQAWLTDFLGIFGGLTGLGTGTVGIPGFGSIPLFGGLLTWAQPLIDALRPYITELLGILSMFGFGSTPGGFGTTGALSFLAGLLNPLGLLTAALDPSAPLNALNLFNLGNILGVIPASQIGQTSPNLLDNPDFRNAISVSGAGIWTYDAVNGDTVPGCASVVANNVLRQLRSNAIQVTTGDKLHLSVRSMWSGLTYTGTSPIKLQLIRLLYSDITQTFTQQATIDIAGPTSPATNQATFTDIVGATDYTVPASTSHICLQLCVDTNASAGTVKFDNGVVTKTGLMQPTWMSGFLGGTTIQDDIQSFLSIFGGSGATLGILQNVWTNMMSIFNVFNVFSQLGISPGSFNPASFIPAANIGGLQGIIDMGASLLTTWNHLAQAFGGTTNIVNEVQQILVSDFGGGSVTGGTTQLEFPLGSGIFTSAIPFNAAASTVQTALRALSSIGAGNINVVGGPLNAAPLQATFAGALAGLAQPLIGHVDALTGGTQPRTAISRLAAGGESIALADLTTLAQQQTLNATNAFSLAGKLQDILNIRNNRPIFNTIHTMSEGSHNIGGGRVMINVTATSAPMSFQVVQQDIVKTFLNVQAYKTGTVTGFYLNLYKMDASHNILQTWNSPNLQSQLGTVSPGAWITGDFSGAPVSTLAGEIYAMEPIVVGSGTVTMLGSIVNDVAVHPTAFPKHPAAVRDPTGNLTPTSITAASIAYGGVNQPHFAFGSGTPPPPHQPDIPTTYTIPGSHTYTIPAFARVVGAKLDLITLGGGGSGQANYGTLTWYTGGNAGSWGTNTTLVCGTDYPTTATTITVFVGSKGAAPTGYWQNGQAGTASTVTWTDPSSTPHTITAAGGAGGGAGGTSGSNGKSPGNNTYLGVLYPGGTEVGGNAPGSPPGGGGGGAGPYQTGGPGSDGEVVITARAP